MSFIDTHCHLTSAALSQDIRGVWERARRAGILSIITVATDARDSTQTVAVADQHEGIFATIGIHPHEADSVQEQDWNLLRELRHNPQTVAWGEMGLDYYYDHSDRQSQQQIFARQLQLARRGDLPVIIHCREAVTDTIAILEEQGYRQRKVVFHCFTGTQAEADKITDCGWWLSFTGIVTFRRSTELQSIVKRYPLEKLMLETDSPYLSPEPHRKVKPNEPHLLLPMAAFLAQLKGIPLDEMGRITTANAIRFFNLPQ